MVSRERFRTEIYDQAPETEQFRQEIILLFILDGNIEVSVDNKISNLKKDDLLVINANKRHTIRAGKNVLYMMLMIDYGMVTEILQNNDVIFWCDSSVSENERYNDLRILVKRMLNHYVEAGKNNHNFGFLGHCFNILNNLAANFLIKVNAITSLDESDRYDERLHQINNYIYTNYDQPISMKELSEKLYLSNGYLSRFFKKNYGMSFASYLTNVRIYHAADELLYTDAPITRIAYNNGFNSAALFNKAFKKAYGITPSEFRKKSQPKEPDKKQQEHQKELEKRLEKMLAASAEEKETGRTRISEAVFSAKESEVLEEGWKEIINFGDASNLLESSIQEHLLILQKALHFKYVRFWGLFSKRLHIDPTQDGEYNFIQIDSILDFILEQDMKPFIELGLKPKLIHYHIGAIHMDEDEQNMMDQVTLEHWGNLMRAFMRHLVNRYGQAVMDDWKMELWYDEDWRLDPEKNNPRYLAFFSETYKIIKECNAHIQVGGYSIRMDVGEKRRKEFLKEWNAHECRPDFISIMYYGYERGEDGLDRYARQTTDNDALLHLLTREKRLIREAGFSDIPVYLNEWNLTPSVRNYINDSTFKGAYIIKNMIDVYGMANAMGYGAGSDRAYAFYDTPELLFGGTGLMTNDGILKPVAFAFDFLNNRLFPYYLGKTKNYLVTTDCHDNYAIVCHNQQILNYNYYLTTETEIEKDAMWKYFEDPHKLNIRICINDAADGNYKIKIYRINDASGSVLHIWEELGFEKDPSRNDIKYFRRACEPALSIKRTEAVGGMLVIEEQLAPNEIAIMRVHKVW